MHIIHIPTELSEVIAECRQVIGVPECSKWSERQQLSHAKWEENRKLMVEALLKQQFLDESLCSNCKNCPAFLNCFNCKSSGPICGACDKLLHKKQPFHDRQVWQNGTFAYIPSLQSVNDIGKVTEIKKFADLRVPVCKRCCNVVDEFSIESTSQRCIVVNLQGGYDFLKHKYRCDYCMEDVDPFTPTSLLESHYWPGSMGNVSYIFDEELLVFGDKLKSFMPGTSESAFLRSLEDLSKERNRQGTINTTAFAKCFKEWKFCDELQMKDQFQCPSCSIEQHASHVDGNCKLYRYKGSGKRSRSSYYGNMFFCDNELVDNALQTLYDDPQIGRMPNSGFTPGEEDEQIFSYLSRIGVTTKYMLPERREETITEHAAAWNKRKLTNFVSDLHKRYTNTLQKQVKIKDEMRQQLAKCPFPVTPEMYENWREEAVLNAEVAQNSTISVHIAKEEEIFMLYMILKEKDELPDVEEHFCNNEEICCLKLSILRIKFFAKSIDFLQRRDRKMRDLENRLKELSGNAMPFVLFVYFVSLQLTSLPVVVIRDCSEDLKSRYETSKKTDDIIKGKIALINRGINYCKLQLQFACDTFGKWITENAVPDVEIAPISSVAVDIPNSEEDSEFGENISDVTEITTPSDLSYSDSDNEYLV
eukprot:gene13481-14877_t